MKTGRLQHRFLWASGLMLLAMLFSSLWSAWLFVRLSSSVDRSILASQDIIDACSELHGALEREDDALLIIFSGQIELARSQLRETRARVDDAWSRLTRVLNKSENPKKSLAESLQTLIDDYRLASDQLLLAEDSQERWNGYQQQANPLLREAVSAVDVLRESEFGWMQQAGVAARDEAVRGTRIALTILIVTFLGGVSIAFWLARSILEPIRQLTFSVEQIAQGELESRVSYRAHDELGVLAAGFNHMAERLNDYRLSSLGELLTAKRTLETVLNALPDAVLVFEPDGQLVASNPPAQRMLEVFNYGDAPSLAEMPFTETHQASIREALHGKTPIRRPLDFDQTITARIDGQQRRFQLKSVPIVDFEPNRCGVAVVLDDVTEFVRLDELRSELIGVASHELKSPLTALQMNLLMLKERAAQMDELDQQLITAAVEGCEELKATIEEFLDMTRVEAGQLRLNLTTVDCIPLIQQVASSLQPRFDDAEVRLELKFDSPPPFVSADSTRLATVIANVLVNALKYSPQGGVVEILVSTKNSDDAQQPSVLQIAVTDQGPGIPEELRERVFEKFFRVEHYLDKSQPAARGTGIGLYLCRQIISAHGGSIHCEPGPQSTGSRVEIALPLNV
jgi:NtrC-family two-component system sensor histidine kinase KinB